MGQNGFYCEIDGIDSFSDRQTGALKARIRELVERDLPIRRTKALTSEVRARYAEEGFTDKIALLDSRPRLYSDLYTLDDTAGYFYGSLAPSTGYVRHFDIEPYYNGFYLALPLRTDPDQIVRTVHQEPKCSASSANTSRGSASWGSPPWATSMPRSSRATPEA